jgi:hypothetical protein
MNKVIATKYSNPFWNAVVQVIITEIKVVVILVRVKIVMIILMIVKVKNIV